MCWAGAGDSQVAVDGRGTVSAYGCRGEMGGLGWSGLRRAGLLERSSGTAGIHTTSKWEKQARESVRKASSGAAPPTSNGQDRGEAKGERGRVNADAAGRAFPLFFFVR